MFCVTVKYASELVDKPIDVYNIKQIMKYRKYRLVNELIICQQPLNKDVRCQSLKYSSEMILNMFSNSRYFFSKLDYIS